MSWQPLDKIYLQESAGKSVGKLPRQRVIREELYNVKYKKESEPEYNDIDVDDAQFKKAYRYLKTSDSGIKKAIESLQLSGLTAIQVKEVIEVVYRYDEPEKFFTALENKMPIEEFLSAPNNNIIDVVASKYDLDKGLVGELLRFAPTTQPVTGRGETFMILFVDGARKGSVGDIEVNGTEYETKGSNARIRGQKGFGSPAAAKRAFQSGLTDLAEKSKSEDLIMLVSDLTNPNFNISVTSNGFIDQIADQLVKTGNVTKEDVALVYAIGFKEIYEYADIKSDLLSWIVPSLDDNGNMNDTFRTNYFLFALKYYAEQENFDYIISMGTAPNPKILYGKMNYVSAEEIKSKSNSVLQKIVPQTFPSFEPSSGLQGPFFAIRPKI